MNSEPEEQGDAPAPGVGDRVILEEVSGVLVADLDRHLFSADFPAQDWAYLRGGYLVLDDDVGLVHVPSGTEPAVQLGPRTNVAEGTTPSDALVARLRERLTAYDGRSPTVPSEAAAQCRDAPGFLDAVIGLASDEDRMVSEAATWILKAELEAGARLDRAMTDGLIAGLDRLEAWQAELHICQAVSHLDVPKTAREAMAGQWWIPWSPKRGLCRSRCSPTIVSAGRSTTATDSYRSMNTGTSNPDRSRSEWECPGR